MKANYTLLTQSLMLLMLGNTFLPVLAEKEARKECKEKDFFKCVDYIIVGAGTAGLTAAWGLTNDKKTSVLVLEAGEDLTANPEVLNPNIFEFFDDLTFDPKFAWIDVTTNNTQRLNYSGGRMLGGSSGHNYFQAMRGTPDIYNEWATITGNSAWSYANLLPLFKSQEHYFANGTTPDTNQRGLSGRLYISQQDPVSLDGKTGTDPLYTAVSQAYQVPFIQDYNDHFEIAPGVYANVVGISANQQWTTNYCPSQTCGERSFSGNSYLKGIPSAVTKDGSSVAPIVDGNNNGINGRKLFVRTSTYVSRVLLEGTRAVGVEVIVNNDGKSSQTMRTRARKGVILCAGSVRSPSILQLSGIGKASDLTPLGIPVLIDNPNVGYNGQEQYAVDVLVKKKEGSTLSPLIITDTFHDIGAGTGVRTCLTNVVTGAFVPTIVLGTIGIAPGDAFENYTDLLSFLLRPKSRSSVVIQSPDPLTPPYVNLNLFSDTDGPGGTSQDLADCVKLFKIGKKAADLYGSTVAYPLPSHYDAAANGDDSLLELDAKLNPRFGDHLSSTCRMSADAASGVVDGKLKVWGTDNLYIADNSIQPTVVAASPSYIAYFIGLQLAKFLGAQLP